MTWQLPPASILPRPTLGEDHSLELSRKLTRALRDLEIPSRVVKIHQGPTLVSFELEPGEGVRMRDYTKLSREADLAFALGAETVRIEAPIRGKHLVGIEVPNPDRRTVALSEVSAYARAPLVAALGISNHGRPITLELSRLPHLAIAGSSGSGKSSLLHALICSLLTACTPDDLRLCLIDVKRVEMSQYKGLPHLLADPIHEVSDAVGALEILVEETESRYETLQAAGCVDLAEYNRANPTMPVLLCVVDELADLMMRSKKRVEAAVTRLGQLGRACGVHLVLATQSPHAEILSGLIKANTPARIALRVASGVHSRVAIDQGGAEKLLGQGDALLQDGSSVALKRFQSAYVPRDTVRTLVGFWRLQTEQPVSPVPEVPEVQPSAPRARFVPSTPKEKVNGVMRIPAGAR